MTSTLFGHLAIRFATHPENLATEAMGYVLRESSVARDALQALLAHSGMPITGALSYQNQLVGEDQGQPDIVGMDEAGAQRLVIEAKFWAGLTDHQPTTYLGRLPKDGGVLLFVAPAAREAMLWGELIRRCTDAGFTGYSSELGGEGLRRYTFDDGCMMAVVSWRTMISFIQGRVEVAGDRKVLGDLVQIQGLCDQMDTTAFLPVTGDDLTTNVYKRVLQFSDLVDDVVRVLVDQGIADTKGLTSVSTKGVYGRYLRFHGVGAYLACDIRRWVSLAPTPLWITIGQQFMGGCPAAVSEALTPLAGMIPPRLFTVEKGLPTIPLYVPVQKTRDEVLVAVLEQLEDLGQRIPKSSAVELLANSIDASGS